VSTSLAAITARRREPVCDTGGIDPDAEG
jgi:hypothetical protein